MDCPTSPGAKPPFGERAPGLRTTHGGAGCKNRRQPGTGTALGPKAPGEGGAREAPPPLPYWIALNLQKEPA